MYGVNHHLSDDDGYEAVACGFTICRIPLSHSVQRTGLVRDNLLIFNIATSNSHNINITIMIMLSTSSSIMVINTTGICLLNAGTQFGWVYILLGTPLHPTSLAMKKHGESFKKSGRIKDHAKHEEHLKIIKSFKISVY